MVKGKFSKTKCKAASEQAVAVEQVEVGNQHPSTAQVVQEQQACVDGYTQQQLDQMVDELALEPTPKRIWEVDFFRGIMILFVVWDHFMWDVAGVAGGNYKTAFFQWLLNVRIAYFGGTLRSTVHGAFVNMFIFTSGISCSFSHNNNKRAIKMVVVAAFLTASTAAVSSIFHYNITINFNVIHVIALSVALYCLLQLWYKHCTKNWQKNIYGATIALLIAVSLIVGYVANNSPWQNTSKIWFFLAEHHISVPGFGQFAGGDYWPFLPGFGWFLIGSVLGKWVYRERKTLFPSVKEKYLAPITFCGKNSLWVYFGSQIIMFSFFYLFHGLLNWL